MRARAETKMKREKFFMNWLDDKVREWDLEPEVEEEFNRLMLRQCIADLRERAGQSSGTQQRTMRKRVSGLGKRRKLL